MSDHILFLTGKLAEKSLHRVLEAMQPAGFTYEVRQIGVSVAGLMTADLIRRRVNDLGRATQIMVPGRCRGDLDALATHFGVPVVRGPAELKDIPQFFGRAARPVDLSRYDVLIFAEIVEATALDVPGILARARRYRDDGADVIDLGCLPDTPFPHLEEAIQELKREGFRVSVDSLEPADLRRGGKAGVDYLLSLKEDTLWIADEVAATPVLIPAQAGDLDSLAHAIEHMTATGRAFFADPVLDPIHFGFTASILRYAELRERFPEVPIMMGIGNLTELTEADTTGVNALLLGIASELRVNAVLATEVSPHARSAVREADLARRVMFAARAESSLPKGYDPGLTTTHERKPFPDSVEEIVELARAVKDPSYRIQVSEGGIHLFNRDGHHTATEAFDLYPHLRVDGDTGHAFYLGVELAHAQTAWELGKRYSQDEPLAWGVAARRRADRLDAYKSPGPTLSHALRKSRACPQSGK
jgi:dihydropteroate synthase-like protein